MAADSLALTQADVQDDCVLSLAACHLWGPLAQRLFMAWLGWSDQPKVSRHVKQLVRGGCLARKQGRQGSLVWYRLTEAGHEMLADHLAGQGLDIGPLWPANREHIRPFDLDHRIDTIRVAIAAERAAMQTERYRVSRRLMYYRSEPDPAGSARSGGYYCKPNRPQTLDVIQFQGQPETVASDAALSIVNQADGRTALYQVEIDRGTERYAHDPSRKRSGSIAGKAGQWADYYRSGQSAARFGQPAFQVLFVAPTPARAAGILNCIAESGQPPALFRVAAMPDIAAHGFLAPIWRIPSGDHPAPVPLLESA